MIVPAPAVHIPSGSGLFDKTLTQTDAAQRLQMLIHRATGILPDIVSATHAPASGTRVFVGYGQHLKGKVTPPTRPEGLKIQELDGCLYLLGEIVPAGVNNCPGPMDRGLMHAVETYAEKVLGYRFLFSTPDNTDTFELGTVVPKVDKFTIEPGLLIEDAPAFQHRVINTRPRPLMGLRSGSAPAFFCNHSYGMPWWAATYGKTHPEMFIPKQPSEIAGGSSGDAVTAMASQPNLSFLDYTEPLVLEKRLEQIQAYLDKGKAGGFYYNPTIKYLVEEPHDAAAPSVIYNDRAKALFNPKHHAWGNFSNIWFDYLNRMAGAAKQRWPNMRISTLAYMRHYGVPTFELADNIDVMVCLMRTSMGNKEPEVFHANLADVKEWSKRLGGDRDRLFLWEYGCWPPGVQAPIVCPNAMQKWLQAVQPYVSGAFIELYDPNEYNYLMRYLWMRLLWNPDLDVKAEIADVCGRFYGPAGATMTEFYSRLIERYETPWKDPKLTWGQYYLDEDLYFVQSYPSEEIERLAAIMETARREAGLPEGAAEEIGSGSFVHVSNAGDARVPLRFAVTALGSELVDPSVLWNTGWLCLRGRLQPGERLEISSEGAATVTATNGVRRDVALEHEGEMPSLDAGRACLVQFVEHSRKPNTRFRAEVLFGADGSPAPAAGELDVYARRMDWVSRAFRVLPADQRGSFGFFVQAHQAHERQGHAAWFARTRADELMAEMNAALARADGWAGDEDREAREKEHAAASEAFRKALMLDPTWKVREASSFWEVIKKRGERAELWLKMGQFEEARGEYEAALAGIPRQQKDAQSYVQMLIGDVYADEENWIEAEASYLQAQKTGLYGDRKQQVPSRLEKVRPLAETQRKQQAETFTP